MKFNTQERTVDGVKFVFVTRRRANLFSEEEIQEYLKNRLSPETWPIDVDADSVEDIRKTPEVPEVPEVTPEATPEVPFRIRNELKSMFMKDLRCGVKFCCDKYGATEDEITDEAKRLAPHIGRFTE